MNTKPNLEIKISWFLRIGVIVAGFLLLAGVISTFKFNGNPFFVFQVYDKIPLQIGLLHHLKHQQWGMLLSYTGLIVLITLPIIRVILTAILFIRQKEYHLACIAIVVLLGLMMSFSLGFEI